MVQARKLLPVLYKWGKILLSISTDHHQHLNLLLKKMGRKGRLGTYGPVGSVRWRTPALWRCVPCVGLDVLEAPPATGYAHSVHSSMWPRLPPAVHARVLAHRNPVLENPATNCRQDPGAAAAAPSSTDGTRSVVSVEPSKTEPPPISACDLSPLYTALLHQRPVHLPQNLHPRPHQGVCTERRVC